MESFCFIQTGDWHIGRVYARFPDDVAENLRRARITAIDRIAGVARDRNIRHILVAGDTYDAQDLSDRDMGAPLTRIRSHPDLEWIVIPGNHDALIEHGVWARARFSGLPANLRLLDTNSPVELARGVFVLPAPIVGGLSQRDPTAYMDDVALPEDAMRIGLAHGATADFGADAGEQPIDFRKRMAAGLGFLALGDWHGERTVADGVHFAGTPEPEQFKTNAAGRISVVTMRGNSVEKVESEAVARHQWLTRTIDRDPVRALADLIDVVAGLGDAAPEAIVRVRLEATLGPAELVDVQAKRADLEMRARHLVWRDEKMVVNAGGGAFADQLGEPLLVEIAERLAGRAAAGGRGAAIAGRALQILLTKAASQRRGEHA